MSIPFTKQVPFYGIILAFLLGSLLSGYLLSRTHAPAPALSAPETSPPLTNCKLTTARLGGYEYVRPLLFVDRECESPRFAPVKRSVSQAINRLKASGEIVAASVFVRDFDQGEWMGVHENDPFHPGSLFKVPILMAYMRMTDDDADLLDRSFTFNPPKDKALPPQNYVSESIEPGKTYTVRQLLRYAISHSDNNAYWLLTQHLNSTVLENMFIELGLGLPIPDESDNQLRTTAKSYSVFIKTLYNSAYLGKRRSEFAMSLLGESSFKEGFVAGLPPGTKVAHKFGEWDDGQTFELHESGIFYIENRPYLVTIMTRGDARAKLPAAVGNLTRTLYEALKNLDPAQEMGFNEPTI